MFWCTLCLALFTIRISNTIGGSRNKQQGHGSSGYDFLCLLQSNQADFYALNGGEGQGTGVSTPFCPLGPSSGICMKYIKILVQVADVYFSYLFTNTSSEGFENSLFFKLCEHSFYNLFTLFSEQATDVSVRAKLKFN